MVCGLFSGTSGNLAAKNLIISAEIPGYLFAVLSEFCPDVFHIIVDIIQLLEYPAGFQADARNRYHNAGNRDQVKKGQRCHGIIPAILPVIHRTMMVRPVQISISE